MRTLAIREESLPKTKKATLDQYEHRINTADRDAFSARVQTGYDLAVIKDQEMYRQILDPQTHEPLFKTFEEYIDTPDSQGGYRFIFTSKEAKRRIRESTTYQLLLAYKEANKLALPLPDNTSKLRLITPFPARIAPQRYFEAVEHAEKCNALPTLDFLKTFMSKQSSIIEVEPEPEEEEEVEAGNGTQEEEVEEVSADDVMFPDDEPSELPPIKKIYSADAQIALNRVQNLEKVNPATGFSTFPPGARQAIEQEKFFIDRDDLAAWGRMEDDQFVCVGRLMFRRKVNFITARRFYMDTRKPMFWEPVIRYAIQEGGNTSVICEDFIIHIKPVIK